MAVNPMQYPWQVFNITHNDHPDLLPGGGYRACAENKEDGIAKLKQIISTSKESNATYQLLNVLGDECFYFENEQLIEAKQ